MSTLGERIKFVQVKSGLQQPQFAKSLGISKETLIHYQKNRRHPDSVFLSNLCKLYEVDPGWLLLGESKKFADDADRVNLLRWENYPARDPVEQLLLEEEHRAGISLTPQQRSAILKILRELVSRDVRAIWELLRTIPGGETQGEN